MPKSELERVIQVCRNTGKIPGFAAQSPEEALQRAAQGFQFLTSGSDVGFLLSAAHSGAERLGL